MERHEIMVSEAVGPAQPLSAVAAAMAMGVLGLLMGGVFPVLMGQLVDTGRLSAPQLGEAAMAEGLIMGIGTGLASVFLAPSRLPAIAIFSALALTGINLCDIWTSGGWVIGLRALAGVPEGLLLWLAIGMIARSQTPERLSAILLVAMTGGQFILSLLFAVAVLPAFGSDGGFAVLALATLLAAAAALWLPRDYAPLVAPEGESASPPLRGWAALAATVVFTSSFPAVSVYGQPIAHQAGHGADVARLALTIALFAQLLGGGAATYLAGRVHYLPVLAAGTAVYLACWGIMGVQTPAWLFIAASSASGFAYLLVTPFLVPMTIEADPSRRAAMMGGGAQVVASAAGPLIASQLVSNTDVHPVLWLGAGLMAGGFVLICGLYLAERRERAHRQVTVVEAA